MKKRINLLTTIIVIFLAQHLFAQKNQSLTFKDIRQWRTHSTTLSDNGKWYTTNYKLLDKSEFIKDSIIEKKVKLSYGEDNQTDILYVFNTETGLKYQIPYANNPVFSYSSEWIAYQIKPESKKKKNNKKVQTKNYIELKHLESGFSIKYESNASYQFLEHKNYFITSDKNSLLIYDLEKRIEHYVGNIGEYIIDEKSDYVAYTIASDDKRGNGVYVYSLEKKTTRALQTGNSLFSNLSWNKDKTSIAFYRYKNVDNEVDYSNINLVTVNQVNNSGSNIIEYCSKDIKGFKNNFSFAIKKGTNSNKITWSNDGERFFVKIKKYVKKKKQKKGKTKVEKKSTVQVWHSKDKKLLSERMMEYDKKADQTFDAIFFRKSNTITQLTDDNIQELNYSKGTDQWAVGLDNQKYISDWDVKKHDLYSINLKTGEKKLIHKKLSRSYTSPNYEISPDGKKLLLWDGSHFWVYDFNTNVKVNITKELNISFINKDYDQFGYVPSYGFVGWVKNKNTIVVNHKYDLWELPLDKLSTAKNLTGSVAKNTSIRYRLENYNFKEESNIEDRYIDLSSPIYLYAFNPQTKYSGYYNLNNNQLTKLIFEPSNFSQTWRRNDIIKSKSSNTIIYTKGDYQNYPESYLSSSDFKKSKKITNTNPQQKLFNWGKRILIDYTNEDGIPLQATLSIPENYKKGKKLPMIVWSYEKVSDRLYHYSTPYISGANTTEMLYVSNGYLYLKPDIHFNVGTPHSDMHECINAAIEKVIELGYVDDKRIGYEGFSFGGHCGMYISTQKNKFAAIAAGAGVSNLVQGFNIDIVWNGSNEQDYYMTGQGRLGTDPTSNTEMYLRESAVFQAQNMNTPLMLFHGTADNVVQWEHSFGFYSILRFLKKPVVFLSYKGEGHGLRKEENRLDIQRRLKEYFDHYLKGEKPKKWMIEELPYIPKKEVLKNKKDKKTLPKWK
ncbi:alpha/beta hydrolase family protein [Tenacibaculum sp. 190524A05c]|uniref:alpha/beta hydrolase family protein n=1 Tax=Tenacibaculum platacis TaxID=3137852 RepID=UPI0032B1AEB5